MNMVDCCQQNNKRVSKLLFALVINDASVYKNNVIIYIVSPTWIKINAVNMVSDTVSIYLKKLNILVPVNTIAPFQNYRL